MSPFALASPASLKGVLGSAAAARHLAVGLRRSVDAKELPVADGGEGTAAVLHGALGGEWRTARVSDPLGRPVAARWLVLPDGTAVVDSAEAIGLPLVHERDPLRASTRGLGELLLAIVADQPRELLVGVGGTATVDGGVGMRDVAGGALADVPMRVLCDVRNPLLGARGAARVFGPQKGADPDAVEELERRLASLAELEPFRDLRGAGAGGGLGAGLAALGAELCDGASVVLDTIGFDEHARHADLVVTGEGTVDTTTLEGKAPGTVVSRCSTIGVSCVLFGGVVRDGIGARALSGDVGRAAEDLEALGEELGRALLERT
ncbi:MAG: glycerate kinase family protein [Gaiellaceae bacterium]